jgi:hypothetical protein
MEKRLKRQQRAKAILPEIRNMITMAATSSNENRETLARNLIDEIKQKYPREIPPVEETVIKLISKARNHEPSPLDKPWSLAVLNHLHELNIFDVNAVAVEYILKVQKFVDTYLADMFNKKNTEKSLKDVFKDHPNIDKSIITEEWKAKYMARLPFLSVRQAKWVSRLYRLYTKTIGNNKNIGRLYFTALIYSNYEIISEISGTEFDTTHLDRVVQNYTDFSPLIEGYFGFMPFDQVMYKAWMRSFTNSPIEKGE